MLEYGKLRAALQTAVIAGLAGCLMNPAALAQSSNEAPKPLAFDAATIKPPSPNAPYRMGGFYGYPGGRVFFGGNIKMLVQSAFNLQDYEVAGVPGWVSSQWFEINAVPPETSPSRNIKLRNAEPTSEQRLMLQTLLRDRFGFKFHLEMKEGDVYILGRSSKTLQLKSPKDPAADPRAIVMMKQGGIADGEAEGINTTTDYLALRLSRYLQFPVFNQTGITGSYDYYLPAVDPENHDLVTGVLSIVDRLGLKIKRGRGTVETLVIDRIEMPSEN
jgi:uncharacterized protein (TIGR03435 family)